MALNSSSILQNLINTGADAEGHLFQIMISDSLFDTQQNETILIRADNINIPELSVPTTDVPYLNTNVKKVSNGLPLGRTFSITFRLDQNYTVYKSLLKLLPQSDFQDNTDNISTYTITINALKASDSEKKVLKEVSTWKLYEAQLTSVSGISYSRASSNPITITANFIYSYMNYSL